MKRVIAVLAVLHIAHLTAGAAVSLPALFSNHMVLQQSRPILIWGSAEPGEQIRVMLAGKSAQASTGTDGRWRATLDPIVAGGPFTLAVECNKIRVLISDVMIGEVWIASGQSNMHFALEGASTAAEDLPAATDSDIRFFTVPRASSQKRAESVYGRWVQCSPRTAVDFSAVAFYFGRELHRRLGVPVGVIQSSWPGSSAEEWIGQKSLSRDPDFAVIAERWRAVSRKTFGAEDRPLDFSLQFDDFRLISDARQPGESVRFGDFRSGLARNALGGEWSYSWETSPMSMIEMVRPGASGEGFALRSSGLLRSSDSALLRADFQKNAEPADLHGYSGIRFHCRGHGYFKVHILQPTIVDWDNYATRVLTAGADWSEITVNFSDLRQAGWGERKPFTVDSLSGVLLDLLPDPEGARPPSGLYNGMIAPLVPFGIRGAIWYQGEGNAGRAYQYRKLLPSLIGSWRNAWRQGDFPFLFVQLPNFGQRTPEPSESDWAELREAQLKTLAVPATGMAVTIDVGEAGNVHPRNKRPVGRRLALWALGDVYHVEQVYSGPIFESAEFEGSAARLHFKHVGTGLAALDGGALRGFAVAGADRNFVWADARIEGDSVVVESSKVAAPAAVRYAWGANPDCNLGNREGLPASPFRSDDWPGLTANSR